MHKDRYKEAKQAGSIIAPAALDDAIDAYRQGFEADPRDYYPGVNAITLLVEKGDEEALAEADRLVPLVSFAVARRGGASSKGLLGPRHRAGAGLHRWRLGHRRPRPAARHRCGGRALDGRHHPDNLALLKDARARQGLALPQLDEIIVELEKRRAALAGS